MFADVVPVAGAMGGESTHQRPAFNKNRRIHLYLRLRYRYIEAGGWYERCVCRGFYSLTWPATATALPECGPLTAGALPATRILRRAGAI
jgi:hypothetical protein